jgi:hypothetical protein
MRFPSYFPIKIKLTYESYFCIFHRKGKGEGPMGIKNQNPTIIWRKMNPKRWPRTRVKRDMNEIVNNIYIFRLESELDRL